MTEAFKQWCESLQMYSEHGWGDAHFWLRAFVGEVAFISSRDLRDVDLQTRIFEAFNQVVRKFGLDGEGK